MTIVHRNGSYPIHFTNLTDVLSDWPADSFAITDSNVVKEFGDHFPPSVPVFVCEPGEASKSIRVFSEALEWLAERGASRNATVVALGGGVVGDLAGFVAAAYMRGVSVLQIPTTLLAQVDSSIGGKVAIDLKHGKNLAGAFHPPCEVRIAVEALSSLPDREFANGLAEVLKYGFILDPDLVESLEFRMLNKRDDRLEGVIRRCVDLKAAVVQSDEFETTGERAILNFGHTVGHAIELVGGCEGALHGEAISVGMVVEATLGELLGITAQGSRQRIENCLRSAGLPTYSPSLNAPDELIAAMRRDKKAQRGQLAFSLLTQIGACKLFPSIDESDVRAALKIE